MRRCPRCDAANDPSHGACWPCGFEFEDVERRLAKLEEAVRHLLDGLSHYDATHTLDDVGCTAATALDVLDGKGGDRG
jgi:hypothetical protein